VYRAIWVLRLVQRVAGRDEIGIAKVSVYDSSWIMPS
jgi:hypothetical protein